MACHRDIAFGIVEKSVTKDLLDGDANLAWNSLKRKTISEMCQKMAEFRADKLGDQVYFDKSSIQYKSLGGSIFWLPFVNKHTR